MLADPFQGLKSFLHETALARVPWLEQAVIAVLVREDQEDVGGSHTGNYTIERGWQR